MSELPKPSKQSETLPLPTVKQVVEAAAAQGITPSPTSEVGTDDSQFGEFFNEPPLSAGTPRPTMSDMNTSKGQASIPTVVGSQGSSNKPLEAQIQDTSSVRSVPLDELFLRPLTEDEILMSPHIVARSFDYSGDEVKVKPINHSYVLRWVQCGDYKGAGTNWLAKQMARGFTFAKEEDIQEEYHNKFKHDEQGRLVIPPDLVLMKIQADIYYGYIKGNMEEARDRVSDKGANSRARIKAAQDMKEAGENIKGNKAPGVRNFQNSLEKNKVAFYDPMAGR